MEGFRRFLFDLILAIVSGILVGLALALDGKGF